MTLQTYAGAAQEHARGGGGDSQLPSSLLASHLLKTSHAEDLCLPAGQACQSSPQPIGKLARFGPLGWLRFAAGHFGRIYFGTVSLA
jgi:hypothetical protein